jgi:hypothetical protein
MVVDKKSNHTWEWRVPEELEQNWNNLSIEVKAAVYMTAQYARDSEWSAYE